MTAARFTGLTIHMTRLPFSLRLLRHRLALLALTTATLTCAAFAAEDAKGKAQPQPQRPNILFLFADDQRFDTLGCAGHPIVQTPTIDALAAQGVRFTNAHVTTSVCWVSRAVVFTGQWARSHVTRNQVPTVQAGALATMFPVELRKAGYRTGHYGKWHLIAPQGFRPEAQFDEYEAVGRNPYFKTMPDGTKRHETDIVCDKGIEFIKSQPKDRPFCLQLSFNAAHAEDGDRRPGIGHYPWPQSTDGMYEDREIYAPRLGDPAIYEAHPQFLKDSINRERYFWSYDTPEKYETNVRAYFRMISGIDKAVARVLAALREAGLAENTIVVYTADNGYYLGDRGFQGKWSHYEESLRVPMVIHDPRVPNEKRGQVRDELVLNVDLPATFLDWAGAATPDAYEGRSLAPLVGAGRGLCPGGIDRPCQPGLEGQRGLDLSRRWKLSRRPGGGARSAGLFLCRPQGHGLIG
jgi:arylsulfatase A-like enzyme